MTYLDWIAFKHPMWIHIPLACAILAPLALLAAQRTGRGIRPWWTVSRFLAWMGVLGLFPALLSGFLWAKNFGFIPPGKLLATKEAMGGLARHHQLWALAAFLLALLTLWATHRGRQDHQGLGFPALFFGCLWAGATMLTGLYGGKMAHPMPGAAPQTPAAPKTATDPEADLPIRYLDFGGLLPVGDSWARIPQHEGRWGRVWITASGVEAYQAGRPLPPGAYAVMSTAVERAAQPGPDPGPLYAVEMLADGKPRFTLYWAAVPEGEQAKFDGQESVYWRSPDPHLQSCASCHAGGVSEPAQRVKFPVR
ncbi:MAG TPA: hypothetical protein VL181_11240 [Holophagaceae bacterium]|nr:hypothetical protein [Holophagaceae bacterium]